MSQHVDIAIIGAGPGGYSTALRAAQLGRSVALIERDETLGGTCLNRGCIPSKALITATRSIGSLAHAAAMGIHASVDSVDFPKLLSYKQHAVDAMTGGLAHLLSQRGVQVYRGNASLSSPGLVQITPARSEHAVLLHGSSKSPESLAASATAPLELSADDVVLATGSRPTPLAGVPFQGAVIDSTRALSLDAFPKRAVIIGAGAIAVEFASMWAQAGCEVTLLIRRDRVLSSWDRRTGLSLTRELERQGITILKHTGVDGIDTEPAETGATVRYHVQHNKDNKDEHEVGADTVLVAIGRSPNTTDPWISAAGIELDDRGLVRTDAWGRASAEHVWAVGDITHGPSLAHRAFAQGIVIAETIGGLDPHPVDDHAVPEVVFSTPEAASVGLTRDAANQDPTLTDVHETAYPMLSNSRMIMSGSGGSLNVVTAASAPQPDVQQVVGVHIVAPDAGDLIAEAQQLIGNHIPLHDAAGLIHPHPTLSETLGEALLKSDGRPLHTR